MGGVFQECQDFQFARRLPGYARASGFQEPATSFCESEVLTQRENKEQLALRRVRDIRGKEPRQELGTGKRRPCIYNAPFHRANQFCHSRFTAFAEHVVTQSESTNFMPTVDFHIFRAQLHGICNCKTTLRQPGAEDRLFRTHALQNRVMEASAETGLS
jgi:hypothetical protein